MFSYQRKNHSLPPIDPFRFNPELEPLLHAKRYQLFPIQYPKAWDQYKAQERSVWRADMIHYTSDRQDFVTLPKNVQRMLLKTLAFFANADNLVLESLADELVQDIQVPEIRFMLQYAATMELVHIETYNQVIQTLVTDPEERELLFSSVYHDPIIQPKFNWAQQFCTHKTPFPVRVVIMLFTEGILFSSSFLNLCMVRYVYNKCHGLVEGNEYIMADEGKHCVNWILIYQEIHQKLTVPLVHAICHDFVEFECEFAQHLLDSDDPIPQLPFRHVCEYIQCVANTLLVAIGAPILYPHASNRFDFMKSIGLLGKTNFFEKKETDYAQLKNESENTTTIIHDLGEFI
jgi:ribonucleoside-diphosphate reductase beta chain